MEDELPTDVLVERLLGRAADELDATVTLQIYPSEREHPDSSASAAGAVTTPVTGADGRTYGELWIEPVNGEPAPATMTETVARVVGERLSSQAVAREAWDRRIGEVRAVLAQRSLRMCYQPIVALADGQVVGVEALARFPGAPAGLGPDRWFTDASAMGLGSQLELAAIGQALDDLSEMGDRLYLAVNVSPETAVSSALRRLLRGYPLERIVFEITEHAEIADYPAVDRALRPLRRAGLRLAVDDAGAGFASLRHILKMSPEIIKLDRSLTSGIDRDPVLRALTYSIAAFASATDAAVVAEGIEAESELDALRFLGVEYGQGFHLCEPGDIGEIAPVTEQVIDLGDLSRSSAG